MLPCRKRATVPTTCRITTLAGGVLGLSANLVTIGPVFGCTFRCRTMPPPHHHHHRLHDHAGGAGGLGVGTTAAGAVSVHSASFETVIEAAKSGPTAAMTAVQAFLANSVTKIEELGALGALYFGVLYVLAEVLIIPAIPLTTAAGFLFGVAGGTAVVLTSATIAAAISFQLGRTLLRCGAVCDKQELVQGCTSTLVAFE